MRTTVTLNDDLLKQAKLLAVERNSSLGHLLDDALRSYLAQRERPTPDFSWADVAVATSGGRGMRPGINPRSNAAMLEAMEEL